jgi:hypothetical protein
MNPRTAGFAAVTTVGQDLVNDILAAEAASVTMPSFSLPNLIMVGADQIGLAGNLLLLPPTVSFKANPNNLIDITIGCSGTLRLTGNGASLVEVEATLRTTLALAFVVTKTATSLAITIDNSNAAVISIDPTVDYGPPLVTAYQAALTSGPVIAAFTAALQAIPAKALTFTIPGASGTFDIAYGGFQLSLAISNVVALPLDGVFDIAIDVSGYTTGNSSQLVDLIDTPSSTPIYFSYDKYGNADGPLGGKFGPHIGVGQADNFVDSYGVNLAAAVNSDFFCAAVNGPLSNLLSGSYLSLSGQTFPVGASHIVVAGDTPSTVAVEWFTQIVLYNAQTQILESCGQAITLGGASVTLTGPSSALPPIPTVYLVKPDGTIYDAVQDGYATISGSSPSTTTTIIALPEAGSALQISYPLGGAAIKDISLSAQWVRPNIAQSSPGLPTVSQYPCLKLSLNGNLISFGSAIPPPPGANPQMLYQTYIGFTFSVSICPILKYTPSKAFWDFVLVDWSYSAPLLTVVDDLFPLGPFIFAGAINAAVTSMISNGLYDQIVQNSSLNATNSLPAYGGTPYPGNTSWNINYNVTGIVVSPDQNDPSYPGGEIDAYAAVTLSGPSTSIFPNTPQFVLTADDSHSLENLLPIFVQLNVTNGTALFEPLLGIEIVWTATRNDTGVQVLNQMSPFTAAATAINITRADGETGGDLIYNDSWSVACEVYRPADALVPRFTYFQGTLQVGLADVVNRHHPYLQWAHRVYIHNPAGPPPLKHHPFWMQSRHSRIHRSDLLIRCSMLDRALKRPSPAIQLQYLDTLAPYGTLAELTNPHLVHKGPRKHLCDYCFFGGPTKDSWRTPTAPTAEWV